MRLVPFAVLCSVVFIKLFPMYETAHFIQQLATGFIIYSAMAFGRAPKPQKEFISADIILNTINFTAYYAGLSIYPHIARVSTPAITTLTALILVAITLQQRKIWIEWYHRRQASKGSRMDAKEAIHGR